MIEMVWMGWCRSDGLACVKFIDMGNVVGANGSNRLGGAGKGDGSVVFIIIGCKLDTAVLSNVGGVGVLFEMLYTHCRVDKVGNVTGEGSVDADPDCFVD